MNATPTAGPPLPAPTNGTRWITTPEPGMRLHLAKVCARLGVTFALLGRGVRATAGEVHQLATYNHWPKLRARSELEDRIRRFLRSAGAAEEDLAALFYVQLQAPRDLPPVAAPAAAAPMLAPRQRRAAAPALTQAPEEPEEPDMLLPKSTLSAQARRHFKLFCDPFGEPVQRAEQLFLNDEFRYVRECVWQCAKNASFVALIGESGAGKTTILDDLAERLRTEARDLVLVRPSVLGLEVGGRRERQMKATDILHAIVAELAPAATVQPTIQGRTLQAQRLLKESADQGNSHLLVLEEAHAMPDPTLKHLKRLHELRAGRRPLMGILLLGQPELKRRLEDGLRVGALREVAQRCEVVEMMPLCDDLGAYLRHRAQAAGRDLAQLIDDTGLKALRERLVRKDNGRKVDLSYPLAVGNAAIRAMNLCAEIGAPVVTAEVVRAM